LNAGLFLLLEKARSIGIFDWIDHDLVFENQSTNRIKLNHIKTMLCGNSENYFKESKYYQDAAVGLLLLKSFWSNEAIFQLMMLAPTCSCCSRLTD